MYVFVLIEVDFGNLELCMCVVDVCGCLEFTVGNVIFYVCEESSPFVCCSVLSACRVIRYFGCFVFSCQF